MRTMVQQAIADCLKVQTPVAVPATVAPAMQQAPASKFNKNRQRSRLPEKSTTGVDQAKDLQQQLAQLQQQLQSEFKQREQLQRQVETMTAEQPYPTPTSWNAEHSNTAGTDYPPAASSMLMPGYPVAYPPSVPFALNVPIGYQTAPASLPDRTRDRRQDTVSSDARCFNCNEVGHYSRYCPHPRSSNRTSAGRGRREETSHTRLVTAPIVSQTARQVLPLPASCAGQTSRSRNIYMNIEIEGTR